VVRERKTQVSARQREHPVEDFGRLWSDLLSWTLYTHYYTRNTSH